MKTTRGACLAACLLGVAAISVARDKASESLEGSFTLARGVLQLQIPALIGQRTLVLQPAGPVDKRGGGTWQSVRATADFPSSTISGDVLVLGPKGRAHYKRFRKTRTSVGADGRGTYREAVLLEAHGMWTQGKLSLKRGAPPAAGKPGGSTAPVASGAVRGVWSAEGSTLRIKGFPASFRLNAALQREGRRPKRAGSPLGRWTRSTATKDFPSSLIEGATLVLNAEGVATLRVWERRLRAGTRAQPRYDEVALVKALGTWSRANKRAAVGTLILRPVSKLPAPGPPRRPRAKTPQPDKAWSGLCASCAKIDGFTEDIGTCSAGGVGCQKSTSSGQFSICLPCAKRTRTCQRCRIRVP